MKNSCLLLLMFFANYCFAQRASISVDKMNIFYVGLDNPITITVENLKPNQYKVFTNNGTIEPLETSLNNEFTVRPKERGKAFVYVVSNKKDTVYKKEFRAKTIPLPHALVANKRMGKISKNELNAQIAIFAKLNDFDYDYKANVASYSIKIFSKCGISYSKSIDGFYFTKEMHSEFDKLNKGDIVIFSDIQVKLPSSDIYLLNDIIFLEIE